MPYPIYEFVQAPGRLRNHPISEWHAIAAQAAADGVQPFRDFTYMLSRNQPLFLDWLCMAHPGSIYPLKEIFAQYKDKFPAASDKKHPEISFAAAVGELRNLAMNGKLIDGYYRNSAYERALNFLSGDEYKLFRLVVHQELDPVFAEMILEHVMAQDFATAAYRHFFKVQSVDAFFQDPDTMFANTRNTEHVIAASEPLSAVGHWGKVFYEYDIENREKGEVFAKLPGQAASKLVGALEAELAAWSGSPPGSPVNIFFLACGDTAAASLLDTVVKDHEGNPQAPAYLSGALAKLWNGKIPEFFEHTFYTSLVDRTPKTVLFASPHGGKWRIKAAVSGEEIKTTQLEFIGQTEIIPFMLFNGKYGMLAGQTADSHEKVLGMMERLEEVPAQDPVVQVVDYRGKMKILI